MFSLLFSFIGKANAQGAGVSEMWSMIRGSVPFADVGAGAPGYFAGQVVSFLFPLIIAAGVCSFIYAGIKMITQGEEGYDEAKTIIRYTALGLILTGLAGSIFLYVQGYLLPYLFS